MNKIIITDITLKKLAAERELALLFREKTAIAACADSLGADAVELAPIKNLREDTIIYKTIAQNIHNAALVIPAGATKEEISNAWECVKDASRPRLQIELPVSTVQMEYVYHIKADKMIAMVSELIRYARELCDDVEFSALDATRADVDFLVAITKEAQTSGAGMVTLCDDAGNTLPNDIASLVKTVKTSLDIPVFVQVSDKIKMAVASAIAAIGGGADGLKAAMAGQDVLLTGEISDAISACSAQLNIETGLNNTKIHTSIDDMLLSINHQSYETEESFNEKKKILLDSDSTINQTEQAICLLGYELSEDDCAKVYKALMQICEKKSAVGAKELEALIASTAMQAPSTYHLENYITNSSNLTSSMSQVTLKYNDEIISGVSSGDGSIDSAFRAIEQCIGHHYELDDFQVQSLTEGKEALGSAVVRLRNNGKLYSGNGISTDIVAASIRAYINALNKIVFEEE